MGHHLIRAVATMTEVRRKDLAALFVLAVITVVFFHGHLMGRDTFPWDFVNGFHGATAYIIENLKRGIWPSWVARQSLGIPLYMIVQSDLWYPTTWLAAALQIEYGLWQANVLQVLHICFGAFGAYKLARSHGFPAHVSTLAGAAFLLMGGFFIQSEHVDYVRGFAFAPWLFWALRLERFTLAPTHTVIILFAICVFIFLGAYPGQLIAFGVTAPVYVAAQIGRRWAAWRSVGWTLLLIGLCVALALALAIPKYLPFLLDFGAESVRAGDATQIERSAASPVLVFSTVLSTSIGVWPLDISLPSFFVTGPIMLLVFASDRVALKTVAPVLWASAVAVLFCFDLPAQWTGAKVFFLSRFPVADYRAIVVLGLIMAGASSLVSLLGSPPTVATRRTLGSLIVFVAFYIAGLLMTHDASRVISTESIALLLGGLALAVLAAATVVFGTLTGGNPAFRRTVVAVLLLLVVADGGRVYLRAPNWRNPGAFALARNFLGFDTKSGTPRAAAMFEPHLFRPERTNVGHVDLFSWRGFFSDFFVYRAYDVSAYLRRHAVVLGEASLATPPAQPGIQRFMARASSGVLLDPGAGEHQIRAAITEVGNGESTKLGLPSGVEMKSYSDTIVVYALDLAEPKLFVENEMFWKGWSATLINPASGEKIGSLQPSEVLSALRAWRLPAGQYHLRVEFREPHLAVSLALAAGLGTGILFLLGLVIRLRRHRPTGQENLSASP